MGLHDALVGAFTVGLSVLGFFYGIGLAFALPVLGFEKFLLALAAIVMLVTTMFPIFHFSILAAMIIVHRKAARPGVPLSFTGWDVIVVLACLPLPWVVGFLIDELTTNAGLR